MKIRTFISLLVTLVMVTFTHLLCAQELNKSVEEVKIGFSVPLSGAQATNGKDMQKGVTLAIETFNASKPIIGGKEIKLVLLTEDDQADAHQGMQIAQKLIDRGIKGMLGPLNSNVSMPTSLIYDRAGIPQSATATAPAYTRQGFKTTFRMLTSDVHQGQRLGNFAAQNLGLKKLVIIDDRSAYGQGLADEFEQAAKAAGAEVVRREFTNHKAHDFKLMLTNIKRLKPQGIFYGGEVLQAGVLVKQMRELGIKATLLGGDALKMNTLFEIAGDAAHGVIVSVGGKPLEQMPGGLVFNQRHKARFGMPVEVYAPYAYDGAMAMFMAMKKADSVEPKKYLPYLAATKMAGVTTHTLAYDEYGDLRDQSTSIYKAADGAWELIHSVDGSN
ncbi:MAG: branched-chain amino acid ABC transporter substrate-binding protein [Ottowia sp.]|nr:branched-chain amino acid ABC transporter substrate-binding protein [Ottowia sp.]